MKKPTIDPLARRILEHLAGKPQASEIILGGYFALQHYLDYRRTHDIDAWWKSRPMAETEAAIRDALTTVAREERMELRERRFGDTQSYELSQAGKKRFSFQIAVRSVALEEPLVSAWPPVLIETLSDNLASKMNALVERGSPRDFLDIKHAFDSGLITIDHSWDLWRKKNPGQDPQAGRQKVLFHLAALEARRPLHTIEDAAERQRAQALRDWYRQRFLKS